MNLQAAFLPQRITFEDMRCCFILILTVLFAQIGMAQPCTTLGQNPSTAFPVCTERTFHQASVPLCSNGNAVVPGCSSGADNYEFKNPFWYIIECYQSGTLGFVITPSNLGDDYDWQLYDITGRNPEEVLTNPSLTVTGNWSGSYGTTGASASGVDFIQCGSVPSDNKPRFARMPNIISGHTYLLMISHFTDTQSGYDLNFTGGTAVITDPVQPRVTYGAAFCDGKEITVRFNKGMRCNTLAINGSDFRTSVPGINAVSASSVRCNTGFNFTEVKVMLNQALPVGTHYIYIQNGTDGNAILDNCDRTVPAGDSIMIEILPLTPTLMDSITPVNCEPTRLELVFDKPIKCNTIAANGTDFTVTGPSAVSVTGATGECDNNGNTFKIFLNLAAPIQTAGLYTVTLKQGSDGTTIIDECGQVTPPSTKTFVAYDTVNAKFNASIAYACDANTITLTHPGGNGINSWLWNFGREGNSTQQNNTIVVEDLSPINISLTVSNGVCSDTASQTLVFDNFQKAAFTAPDVACPGEAVNFVDHSVGNIVAWQWAFGNGNSSADSAPSPQFFSPPVTAEYMATPTLITTNNYGCKDTIAQNIKVVFSCFVSVPSAFTPNGDGLNDYLYPLVAYRVSGMQFSVYNRFGQRVYYTETPFQKWDGRFKGEESPTGTYVWQLRYTDMQTGQKVYQKGTVILIR